MCSVVEMVAEVVGICSSVILFVGHDISHNLLAQYPSSKSVAIRDPHNKQYPRDYHNHRQTSDLTVHQTMFIKLWRFKSFMDQGLMCKEWVSTAKPPIYSSLSHWVQNTLKVSSSWYVDEHTTNERQQSWLVQIITARDCANIHCLPVSCIMPVTHTLGICVFHNTQQFTFQWEHSKHITIRC